MKIGDINTLKVARESDIGIFLADEDGLEVLLPKRYVPEGITKDQALEVFVYKDSEDRVIATTEHPKATVNRFAYLEVKDQTAIGAFLDWGLPKDLFVPKKEMLKTPSVGDSILVFVYLDRLTQRLVASMRLEKFLSERPENLNFGDKVNVIVWRKHERGFQVVVDEEYLGMIYHNQMFQKVQAGDRLEAYVNQIRTDGRLDLLLQAPGYKAVDDSEGTVMKALIDNSGRLPFHDKSPSGLIQKELGMSKKVFKKVIGGLYKQGKISIHADGIVLNPASRRSKR